jgi:hypothetical protein
MGFNLVVQGLIDTCFGPLGRQHEHKWNTAVENTESVYTACHQTRIYAYITTKQYLYIYIYTLKFSLYLKYEYTYMATISSLTITTCN